MAQATSPAIASQIDLNSAVHQKQLRHLENSNNTLADKNAGSPKTKFALQRLSVQNLKVGDKGADAKDRPDAKSHSSKVNERSFLGFQDSILSSQERKLIRELQERQQSTKRLSKNTKFISHVMSSFNSMRKLNAQLKLAGAKGVQHHKR